MTFANAAWIIASWAWVDREYWLWIIPIALSINFLLISYDQFLHFRTLVGHPLTGNDAWGILKIVHDLATEMRIPSPKIFLIPRPSAQIFAYAKRRRTARLLITQGMLELMNPSQLRAVLTFQMIAIRSSYSVVNYWMAALLDLLFRLGKALERSVAFVFGWSPPLAAGLIAPWLSVLHVLLLGRRDFQKMDADTARMLDNPEDLAQALWKMESYAQTRPWAEPWIFAHMCMVSPFSSKRSFNFLRVQPPVKSRIQGLIGRYPL